MDKCKEKCKCHKCDLAWFLYATNWRARNDCCPGKPGPPGEDGDTPFIGENGNWWIGETDTNVFAVGLRNLVDGNASGAVRGVNAATGYTMGVNAVALGTNTTASGHHSHAEGRQTTARGQDSHAEGYQATAIGPISHAEGRGTTASGTDSHAEGSETIASGPISHAEGRETTAEGWASHAEGQESKAVGFFSHAEGFQTTAIGWVSHAGGHGTIAEGESQTAIGRHNIASPGYPDDNALIIGNGADSNNRSNAFRFTFAGDGHAAGSFTSNGADYAEMFEWQDGNPQGEDRRGYFVTLDGNHIRKANSPDEYILGVVSGTPAVIGNAAGCGWRDMYLRDRFGEIIHEWVDTTYEHPSDDESELEAWHKACEEAQEKSERRLERDELPKMPMKTEVKREYLPKLNPAYDPGQTYAPRDKRKEWAAVGMMGMLIVRDDGTCRQNGFCTVAPGGIATASEKGYRAMERLGENTVRILYLPNTIL